MLNNIPWEDQQSADVQAAKEKLNKCEETYQNLPARVKYTFNSNVCTLTGLIGATETEHIGKFTYTANGTFPAGTYEPHEWIEEKGYAFYQNRLIIKSDGTGISQYREAKDANGTGATPWEENEMFTYKNEGTQATGGIFFITFEYEEEEDIVNPDNITPSTRNKAIKVAKTIRRHSLFSKP